MIEVLTSVLTELSDGFLGFFHRNAWEVLHDCFDIGLVAVLIYWALVILRGTRAMQVAIGLCLVFVGYLFARRVGLVTVTTILDSVLAYLAVIVVIIFQSDIRRALARMGRRPLLRGQRTAKETQTMEEVIKAAGTLAQKRIGALVAFEHRFHAVLAHQIVERLRAVQQRFVVWHAPGYEGAHLPVLLRHLGLDNAAKGAFIDF